jgi:hypothetical protein
MTEKEPREHGILFGRGEPLGDEVEEPPTAYTPGSMQIPGYGASPIAFGRPPEEAVELTGEIPWELREDPPDESHVR